MTHPAFFVRAERGIGGGKDHENQVKSPESSTIEKVELETWSEGPVFYWPENARKKGKPPIPCRLIRVPAKGKAKNDVWLLTNILDSARLSLTTAAKFYRWRWRNEGVFRT